MKEACERGDLHNEKIAKQKLSLKARAVEWEQKGEIDAEAKQEIIYMVDYAPFNDWRPLIYVIPRAPLDPGRIKAVPFTLRASSQMEWYIEDLKTDEFDVIEL